MLNLFLAILLVCSTAYCSLIPPVIFGNTIRDLYATDSGDMIMMASQWTINGSYPNTTVVSRCSNPVLGGIGRITSQGSFARSYTNLPVHNVVDLALNVRIIDMEDIYAANLLRVKIDNVYFQTFNINALNGSLYDDCGGSNTDLNINLSLMDLAHSSSMIIIEISWEMDSSDGVPAFAIRDLVLSFQNSDSPGSNNCPIGFYNNNGTCMACDLACENCFGPSSTQCFPCQMGYNLVRNECVQCPSNCSLCSGPNEGQCLLCNSGYTLDFDGTCNPQGICKSSPYVIEDNNQLVNYGYSLSVCAHSCSEGEAMLQNHTCTASCDSPLQKVTENGTLVCKSPCNNTSDYILPNGSCVGYCPGSARYVSGFSLCDLPCDQYLYPNGSCLPTCAAPYAIGDYMYMMTCENPCPYPQYLFPDGSCHDNCSIGYQVEYQNTISGGYAARCYFPCDSDQYLYQNGTCSASCRADFNEQIDSFNNKVCNFPCANTGGALYDNGTCSYNCPTSFIYREGRFKFCRFPCASNQYYSNGRCTASCEAGSTPRTEGSFRLCDSNTTNIRTDAPCSSPNLFKYQNGSCLQTCPFPLSSIWQGYYAYCTYPCSPGNYLYPNTSCLPDCQPGYVPRIDGNMSFCDYAPLNPPITDSTTCFIYSVDGVMTTNCSNANNACPPDSFQYQNGSCLSYCNNPYYSILRDGSAYCSSPCASNEFLYPDGTCSMICTGGMSVSENNFGFCDTNETSPTNGTCPQGLFKYDNGSCLSTCHFPLSTIWEDGNALCRSPCSPDALLFPNGTCGWSCNVFWHVVVEGSIQYCKPPCPNDQFIYNGTCISTCDPPRKQTINYELNYCNDVPLTGCSIFNATWYGDGYYETTCYNPYTYCDSSNFEYEDGSCVVACRYPMIPEIRNLSAYCVKDPNYTGPDNTACWPWEYAYPNGSCLSTCDRPYVSSYNYQNNSVSCALPCSPDMYTYDNGNCSSTCDSGFIHIATEDYKYCKFPCLSGQYLLSNGTCSYFCPSGNFEVINSYPICYPDNQTSCGTYEYNGQIGNNCSNPDTVCGPGRFQYEDNTCSDSCVYPYVPLIVNSSAYCILNTSSSACPSGELMYFNGSCLSTCPPPLQINWNVTTGSGVCNSPCSYGAYVYENGTCQWTCPYPYEASGEAPYLFCNAPCPAGEYFYLSDGNCTNSCRPGTEPYMDLGINYCIDSLSGCAYTVGDNGSYYTNCTNPDDWCEVGQFLRSDNSCSTTCDPPSVPYISGSTAYCLTNQTNTTEPYCEIYSSLFSDTTNCTNPSNNCGQNQFQYSDGHCDYYCYHPQYYAYISNFSAYCLVNTTNPNNQTNTTNPSCEIYSFGDSYTNDCTNPDHGCDEGEFLRSDYKCSFTCDYPSVPYISGSSAYCNIGQIDNYCEVYDQGRYFTTNCTNQLNLCDVGQFLLSNGNCSCTCDSPSTPYIANFSAYCFTNQTNTTDPSENLYCEEHSTLYNATNNCTNLNNNCGPDQFEYADGHCDYYCYHPQYYAYIYNFSAYCIVNSTNTNTTNPNNQTNTTNPYYCKIYSALLTDTTNCTNPSNTCLPDEFEYSDAHCDFTCNHPLYYSYISDYSAYCARNTSNADCETYYVEDEGYYIANCPNSNTWCGEGQFVLPNYNCTTRCYPPDVPYISGSVAYCLTNQTNTTNTTDPSENDYCEIYSTTNNSTTNCTNPSNSCGQDQFLYADGHCDYYCPQPSYYPYIFNFSAYCAVNSTNTTNPNNQTNNTGTVSLQIYIRYNMSLIDFNSQDGLNRFIQQLALILGVDPSDIVILDVREGSTIIESAVVLTSESDQSSMNAGTSRAQEMSQRYSSAIADKQLNLFSGVDILDSRQSVQVSTPSAGSVSQVLSSKSSSGSAVGIGVGAGLAALFVVVGGYWLYRRYRARKDIRSTMTESNVVREIVNQNDQEANDGKNSMAIKTVNETELKPQTLAPLGLELGQERDISFEKKMKDIEKIGQQQEQGQGQEQQDDDNEEIPISLDAILNPDKIDINITN